jgi:hypothetical protein
MNTDPTTLWLAATAVVIGEFEAHNDRVPGLRAAEPHVERPPAS